MSKRVPPALAPTALVAVILLAVALSPGCSLTGSSDQALSDAQAAKDEAQQELTDAQQEIADLRAQVKDLKKRLAAATAAATASPSPTSAAGSGGVHTPPAGSDERTAILDAVRKKIKWTKLFVVHDLKVQNGWAYAELEQTDPAQPAQKYESFSAVCKQSGSSWACLEALGGSDAADVEETSGRSLKEWLQDKYPAAPAAIFQ